MRRSPRIWLSIMVGAAVLFCGIAFIRVGAAIRIYSSRRRRRKQRYRHLGPWSMNSGSY